MNKELLIEPVTPQIVADAVVKKNQVEIPNFVIGVINELIIKYYNEKTCVSEFPISKIREDSWVNFELKELGFLQRKMFLESLNWEACLAVYRKAGWQTGVITDQDNCWFSFAVPF